jgi:lipid-binding SYLF domain-containing protein
MACALVLPLALAQEEEKADKKEAKAAEQRDAIDKMAQETLDQLFADSEKAKELYGEAVGYAVFSNYKFQFIFSGGGGQGVAVDKSSGQRTYMKMGTGGVGLGIGGKKSSVVFLFQDAKSLESFITNGWQADTQAGAAAGTADASAEATFKGGVRYYQLNEKGLIASADISGTRYWKSDKLNE